MPKFQGIINQTSDFVTLSTHVRMPHDIEYEGASKQTDEEDFSDNSDTVSTDESFESSTKTTKRGKK